MFTNPPALAEFDSRLTPKFFEGFENELVGLNPLRIANISRIRKEIITQIVDKEAGLKIPPTSLNNPLAPLLNFFAPLLRYEPIEDLVELTPVQARHYEKIRQNLLVVIKTHLTVEMVLWYILESKIGFRLSSLSLDKTNLIDYLDRIYKSLNYYGVDHSFTKVIDFTNPEESNLKVISLKKDEIYSNLMTSLLRRLADQGYFNLKSVTKTLGVGEHVIILANCKTVSLMYVQRDNQPAESLITYAQQENSKILDSVIESIEFLYELLQTIMPANRMKVWQHSFTFTHLIKIIKNPYGLHKVCQLFNAAEQGQIRQQFSDIKFLTFDSALLPKFFVASTDAEERKLPETLMQGRRSIIARKSLELLRKLQSENRSSPAELTNVFLNFYAKELGIKKVAHANEQLINSLALESIVNNLHVQITQEITLSGFLENLYITRIKTQIENLLNSITNPVPNSEPTLEAIESVVGLINSKLNFYGLDPHFSPYTLFDESNSMNGQYAAVSDIEVECQILMSLARRLADQGYADLTKYQKLDFENDVIYYLPNNSIKLAFVNNDKVSLISYMLNQEDYRAGIILQQYPQLVRVLEFYSEQELSNFYQGNYANAPKFIVNFQAFVTLIAAYSADMMVLTIRDITSDTLQKIIQCSDQYLKIIELVPILSLQNLLEKFPIQHFQKIHSDHTLFFQFFDKLFGELQDALIGRLSRDYLQNIHTGRHEFKMTVKKLSVSAIIKFCKKLGKTYLQCLIPNSVQLADIASVISPEGYYAICNALSDAHLRHIFHDQATLPSVTILKVHKVDFIIKLVNCRCGAYNSLFSDLDFLLTTLMQIRQDEVFFVKNIKINFFAVSKKNSHLMGILRAFNHSISRFRFCQSIGPDIIHLVKNDIEFMGLYNLLNKPDRVFLRSIYPVFEPYYENLEKSRVEIIESVMKCFGAMLMSLSSATTSSHLVHHQMELEGLALAVMEIEKKAVALSDLAVDDKFDKLLNLFAQARQVIEAAFINQCPKQGKLSLFAQPGLPAQQIYHILNSGISEHYYARYLGLLLHHIYKDVPLEGYIEDKSFHTVLHKVLIDLKQPPAHDEHQFLIPAKRDNSQTSFRSSLS